MDVPIREKSEIQQLAIDIAAGKVVGTWDLSFEDACDTFPLLLTLPKEQVPIDLKYVYQYINKGACDADGNYIFLSFNMLRKENGDQLDSFMKNA